MPAVTDGLVSGNCKWWAVPQPRPSLLSAAAAGQLGILQMKKASRKLLGALMLALSALYTAPIVFQTQLKKYQTIQAAFHLANLQVKD